MKEFARSSEVEKAMRGEAAEAGARAGEAACVRAPHARVVFCSPMIRLYPAFMACAALGRFMPAERCPPFAEGCR